MTTSERNLCQASRQPLPWRNSRSCLWGLWGDSWAACWRPCCLPVLRTRRWSLACVCACVRACLHLGQRQQEGWAAALWVKKHVSVVFQQEQIPFVARASVVEEPLCWKGFRVSVPALRLSDCFLHVHLFLSFPFYRLCPLVSSPSLNFLPLLGLSLFFYSGLLFSCCQFIPFPPSITLSPLYFLKAHLPLILKTVFSL